jgi:hypothetical protein
MAKFLRNVMCSSLVMRRTAAKIYFFDRKPQAPRQDNTIVDSGRQIGGRIALARASWIGGQGTSPYEQNTQQSPGFGFIRIPQLLQS